MPVVQGTRLGRYVVERELGVGGMAIALLCRREGIGGFSKHVVAKIIRPQHVDNESFVRMFLDEARIAASLSHPNIAQVFEVDHVDRFPFLIMEYVHGPPLDRLIRAAERARVLHHGHVARILAGACRGLQYAHDAGMIHRDVTFQNILVATTGETKLIDFGIAKADNRLEETRDGVLKGKLRFLAPESFSEQKIDHRADVYAIGVCLYRATVGHYPFDGDDSGATIAALLRGEPVPPSRIHPSYPETLERIVLRALCVDRDRRYPSAEALARDLDEFSGQGPFACDNEAVVRLIRRLFPRGEADWLGTAGESSATSGLFATLEAEKGTRRRYAPLAASIVAGAAVIVAAGGLAGLLAWEVTRPSGGPDPVAAAALDASVRSYLDETERLLAAGDPSTAGRLLARVDALEIDDPALLARSDALRLQIERALASPAPAPAVQAPDPSPAPAPVARARHEPAEQRPAAPPSALAVAPEVDPVPPAAPVAAPVPAVEPAPEVQASAAAPRPTPAPGLDRTVGDALPIEHRVRSPDQLKLALGAVERHAVKAGGDARLLVGVTDGLAANILRDYSPGSEMVLYPRATFLFLLEGVAIGSTAEQLDQQLRRAHERGQLR